jgi:prepilin signal peptidase PulO-like enzyme (type II secretory pathway)
VHDLIAALVVVAILAVATFTDLKGRRVPIWLTCGGMAAGLIVAATQGGPALLDSALGMAVGALVLLPFVFLGGFGGGDALLLGAIGAWYGWLFVLWALWWTALAGGVLALVAWWRKQRSFPYVPAIAIGTLLAMATFDRVF